MLGAVEKLSYLDHEDAYADMVSRKEINEGFAKDPLDFNVESLRIAADYKNLSEKDKIADIGCSSGAFILRGAEVNGITSQILGVDPNADALQQFLPPSVDDSRFTLIEGYGEDIPLPDNSVAVVTALNVLFRAADQIRMLREMTRVAEPGGLIFISTNNRYHAHWRHTFERVVAKIMEDKTSMNIEAPSIPAEGCYWEDLPAIIEAAGGLQVVEEHHQRTEAVITSSRVDDFIRPLDYSANRTNLPVYLREQWRETVRKVVLPRLQNAIAKDKENKESQGSDEEPCFKDTIRRGMVVARVTKAF